MTRIAFYAPLKSPDHPVPSGDRQMARSLMGALANTGLGDVTLMSHLRLLDKTGSAIAQARLRGEAEAEIARLVDHWQGRDLALWVSYHNYYKAPDLVGPRVAAALRIPYVQIESTRALKRLGGPWDGFARAAHDAADQAAAIFYFTAQDQMALARDRCADQALVHLRPFLNRGTLPDPATGGAAGPILSVGMMRPGDKLASYRIIADTLACLDAPFTLQIAGDGPERPTVAALMAPFGDQVRFLGELEADAMARAYGAAACLFWPGVNEAFGMSYLEAQAAGLPVVAQDRPGLRDVLAPGTYPDPQDGAPALARRLMALRDPRAHAAACDTARAHMQARHLRPAAIDTLRATLAPLIRDAS
ncbi:MAG: glycosyltransferase [Marinibacterium sp.]|nr:glycosyltransferase [Marinibacterium sp.]